MSKIINVNKLCRVNEEGHVQNHYTNVTVLNVSALDDTTGFVQFVLAYDDRQDCCETCWHESNVTNKEVFVNKITLIEDSVEYKNAQQENVGFGLDDGSCVSFEVDTQEGIVKGFIANSHNGYYSHEVTWELQDGEENLIYEQYI